MFLKEMIFFVTQSSRRFLQSSQKSFEIFETLRFWKFFFGASEASVDCFQSFERSQNSPSLKGWIQKFIIFEDGVV